MKTDSATHPLNAISENVDLDAPLSREWLITNGRGGYASGTVAGVPTRKYHACWWPPPARRCSAGCCSRRLLERVGVSGRQHDMSSFEFERTIHPRGYAHQRGFACYNDRTTPWVRFVYEHDGLRLLKEVAMRRGHDEVPCATCSKGPPASRSRWNCTPSRRCATTTRSPAPFAGSYPVRRLGDFVALDAYADGPRLVDECPAPRRRPPV